MRKLINLSQGLYYFVTGVWPIIAIDSFMHITGPKVDLWLVKMVALLSITNGLAFISTWKSDDPPIILNFGTAGSFLIIDTYYSLNGIISLTYLADAAIQLIFLGLLLLSSQKPG